MNKRLSVLLSVCLLCACTAKKSVELTDVQIKAKADSIVSTKMDDLNKQAKEDLDNRMAIELRAQTDSIIDARTGKTDTTHKAPTSVSRQVMPVNIFHKRKL